MSPILPPTRCRAAALLTWLSAALVLSGCGMQRMILRKPLAGLNTALRSQPDPGLVRDGLPSLMLIQDGLIAAKPNSPDRLRLGATLYTLYGQSFLSEPANAERLGRVHERAYEYALALLRTHDELEGTVDGPVAEFETALEACDKDDVPDLYVAGTAWLSWILSHSDSMAAIADIPKAMALMHRVLELDPNYDDGGVHTIFGIWYAAQPRGAGQDIARARRHFQRAIALAGPDRLMPRVLHAEFVGMATLDEELFTETLHEVLAYDAGEVPTHRLENRLAQQRAERLLETAEDYF